MAAQEGYGATQYASDPNASNLAYDAQDYLVSDLPEHEDVNEMLKRKAAENPEWGDLITSIGGTTMMVGAVPGPHSIPTMVVGGVITAAGLVVKHFEGMENAKTEAEFKEAALKYADAQERLKAAQIQEAGKQQAAMQMASVIGRPA